ncbi:PadR family transcriptional regulator [Gloeothece verrucosa]|uniref:Transcriptional regulator, PadR-like family n=1 Tax=Gloeothece verrucosa (strain PCC 7822) TaxID=497965 RepID=E0UDL2_GLOV7|nr:PadR family transcriptional regulator [Gloeothece verrucosa]ADN15325.1 transcriptional regulator, PadR-like family [Gloeothece verrucosa PCC 7822]
MMLELATLGLLQGEPLHGYRLKQQLELFMSGCISVNYGAIYPLLKRLEERELIEVCLEEDGSSGNSRKIYSITEKGREQWKKRMLEQPQESWVHARSRFFIKFFFFSYLSPQERLKLLEHRLRVCQLRLENQDIEVFPPDPYQSAAWERCQEVIQDEIGWLERQIVAEKAMLLDAAEKKQYLLI